MTKGRAIFYSPEMLKWIESHVKGCPHKQLTENFNKTFKTDYTVDCLRHLCQRKGWHNGFTGCFEKGHIPDNKGKKMPDDVYQKCKATMFKKGNTPYNHRPVGSERLCSDGYMYVKVAEPNKWRMKHHVEWEKHNEPLKKGEMLCFIDGNSQNCAIDNLFLTKKKYAPAISRNIMANDSPQLRKSNILLGGIQTEVKEYRIKNQKRRAVRSDRYSDIENLISSGMRTFEIAKKLNISANTVNYYARRLKLGIYSQGEMKYEMD